MESCCKDGDRLNAAIQEDGFDFGLLEPILAEQRNQEGGLISVLQEAQQIYGYLPLPVLRYIAAELRVKPAKVHGVATFYTQFRLTPVGKYVILLCQGTACHVNNSERLGDVLCEELNIRPGETTGDGLFTLNNVACLGCCSLAPVMMINGQAYGHLTPEKACGIVRDIYARERADAEEGAMA